MQEYHLNILDQEPNWNFTQELGEPVFLFTYADLDVYLNPTTSLDADPSIFYLSAINNKQGDSKYIFMGLWLIKVVGKCVSKTSIFLIRGDEKAIENLTAQTKYIVQKFALLKLKEENNKAA